MRQFFKGFLIGTAAICILLLVWLLLIQPALTRAETQGMKAAYTVTPGAGSSGGALLSEGEEEERKETSGLDLSAMQKQYPDMKAWLTIPGTPIDYPVLQSSASAPEYYLRRNIEGEYRLAGSLFFQYDCSPDDRYIVIYGHHMNDGTMFGCLPEYMNADFCTQHSIVTLQTLEGEREYRIAAVLETDALQFPFNRVAFADEADFLGFVQDIQAASRIDTGVPITADSQVLALVTCSYSWENARYVIVAVKNQEGRELK